MLYRGSLMSLLKSERALASNTKWRDTFLQGGLENLKDKPTSPINTENQMLKQMIGEKSMEIELLYQKVEKLEAGLRPKFKRSQKFQK